MTLLPTPSPFHMGNNETPEGWRERRADVQARTGTQHGPALPVVARSIQEGDPLVAGDYAPRPAQPGAAADFGPYTTAVRRWEAVIDRPAPPPTITVNDSPRLNPDFVEWMMGLPPGHVTASGCSRTAALKMLGNGVVPQQALLALQLLDPREEP